MIMVYKNIKIFKIISQGLPRDRHLTIIAGFNDILTTMHWLMRSLRLRLISADDQLVDHLLRYLLMERRIHDSCRYLPCLPQIRPLSFVP